MSFANEHCDFKGNVCFFRIAYSKLNGVTSWWDFDVTPN